MSDFIWEPTPELVERANVTRLARRLVNFLPRHGRSRRRTLPAEKWPAGKNVSPKSMRDVSYSFANMLTWARATESKVRKPAKSM